MSGKIILHHAAPSRSSTALFMLEEIGAPYEMKVLDLQKEEQLRPEYLAINPMGKVPAIEHNGAVITEVGAICTYLADAFPAAGLAPPIGDPQRGPYLRWMFFQGNCLEPAIIDHALKREPGRRGMMPYGDYDTTVGVLEKAIEKGPWFLGERYSAADVYVGSAIAWGLQFKLLPERDAFKRYADRLAHRPAQQRATEIDGKLMLAKSK
ncbi:MAG TPA: glutathione S-transferase family protein [Hyphomicrobiaceae bacterium]|nr:glutathione S-transferase family protein [Hyphomicrobiaceae bacterium]